MQINIAFTGDIAFSGFFQDAWQEEFISKDIIKFLREADYVITNIESPVTDYNVKSSKPLNHVSSTKSVNVFKKINSKIWNIANNHIMDCGEEGLLKTIKLAESNDCVTIGAGMNRTEAAETVIIGNELKIGFLAVTSPWNYIKADVNKPGTLTWDETDIIKEKIKYLKSKTDWVVVMSHGGDEFADIPLPYVRKQYLQFLQYGADVVVGHHPHVVQNYEKIGNKIIFYSLGNFIFDTNYQRIQPHTDVGVVIKFRFEKDKFSWDTIATRVDRNYCKLYSCEIPTIFNNISSKEYKQLWPLSTLAFVKRNNAAQIFKYPECSKMTNFDWMKVYFKDYQSKRGRNILIGYLLARFKLYKLSNRKEILRYILK